MSFIKKKKMPGHPDPVHRRERVESHNNGQNRETETSRKRVDTSHHWELMMTIFAL